jgi:REP element-mobilizing transposase RayT
MPPSLRLAYPGAFYHVMARGNRRQEIFHDDYDRRLWLQTLAQACARTGWRVHAWVLMSNHYHLFLETPEPNLSHRLQTSQLASLAGSDGRKVAIARDLWNNTTVSQGWIAARLHMKTAANVSQILRRARRAHWRPRTKPTATSRSRTPRGSLFESRRLLRVSGCKRRRHAVYRPQNGAR